MSIGSIIRVALIALMGVGAAVPTPGNLIAQAHAQAHVQKGQAQPQNRDEYLRRNEGRFEEWGRKMDDFKAKAAKSGQQAKERAKREVDEAWSDVKTGWSRLKSASQEGWEDARDALESGWRKLERAWRDAES